MSVTVRRVLNPIVPLRAEANQLDHEMFVLVNGRVAVVDCVARDAEFNQHLLPKVGQALRVVAAVRVVPAALAEVNGRL